MAETTIQTAGSRQRIAPDHVRVPSPMIGKYTLDLRVNSIRDTGTYSFVAKVCLKLMVAAYIITVSTRQIWTWYNIIIVYYFIREGLSSDEKRYVCKL